MITHLHLLILGTLRKLSFKIYRTPEFPITDFKGTTYCRIYKFLQMMHLSEDSIGNVYQNFPIQHDMTDNDS